MTPVERVHHFPVGRDHRDFAELCLVFGESGLFAFDQAAARVREIHLRA